MELWFSMLALAFVCLLSHIDILNLRDEVLELKKSNAKKRSRRSNK